MCDLPIRFAGPLTLVGAGALTRDMLDEARAIAPDLVAADRGADRLSDWRIAPHAVIGDMDSAETLAHLDPTRTRLVRIAEQDTTDFEKCLYATEASFHIAVGFTGGRTDHTLAVFHAMLRHHGRPVIVLGEQEAIALAPAGRRLRLALEPGMRVSIFPLLPVRAQPSRGLVWPLAGLTLAPGAAIGTSNEASEGPVEIGFDDPGALVMVERPALPALVHALVGPYAVRRSPAS